MTTLSDEVKTFVVQQLACFDAPSVVVAAVKDEFGVSITRQAVEAYDPNKVQGQRLSEELKQLFAATRERFLSDQAAIGVSHRMVRLRRLERLANKAEAQGNTALAASLLEQVAKECGDAFSNRRVLDNNVSGSLDVGTKEQRDAAVAAALRADA
ncbi:DUF2280 domain-containing protein [Methylorubrum aminovorans]|uniref:DUF2280 domain-containing protein n=1 Tax=Methylorubrum aminovorans TaxID=269069 RepID=UPI003C2E53C8